MSGYSNAVKDYVERYKAEVGSDGLLDPHAVAEWAYRNGLHKPNLTTVIDAIASANTAVWLSSMVIGSSRAAIFGRMTLI